ncbi:MAG: lipopolysaccharide biosynthesis protein, partial [Terracidiphilus sp.]
GWYGVETAIDNGLTLLTSIAIARYLGPETAGYILFVQWLAQVSGNLGAVGIPATLRKYMGEFLGKGDRGTARFIYLRTLLLQTLMATVATSGIVLWVRREPSAELRLACILIALSIWPQMVNSISAQANVAAEDLFRNMPASAIQMLTFFFSIMATVFFHWGVVGVGASVLLCRSMDFLVRFIPTFRWIYSWEITHVHPDGLRERAIRFAWQSLVTMAAGMVVWDRSEYFLLKYHCSEISQIAFYSVAFSMANRLLVSSTIFGSATGATIFAQYGRDESKLPGLVSSAFRYLALSSIPIHTLFTALAIPVLLVLYGNRYAGAEAVVAIAPLLCMSKAFLSPVQNLLQSFEKQRWIIAVTVIAGAIDVGLAWILIPAHGAVGACIANGVAQFLAVALLWGIAIRMFKIKLPWLLAAKVAVASASAALASYYCASRIALNSRAIAHPAHSIQHWLIDAPTVLAYGCVSLAVLLLLFYLFRILQEEDRDRLNQVAGMLPGPLPRVAKGIVSVLIRTKRVPVTATNAALF